MKLVIFPTKKKLTDSSLAVNGITVNFKRMTNKLRNNHDNMNNQKNKTFFVYLDQQMKISIFFQLLVCFQNAFLYYYKM